MDEKGVKIRIAVDAKQGIAAVGEQAKAVASLRQHVEVANLSMRNMAVAIAAGNAAFAALGAAIKGAFMDAPRALIEGALSAERFYNAFKALEGSAELAAGQIAFVRAEAQRLGLPIEAAADAWLKLAAAARGTALEGEAARRIFSAVAGAAATLGLSASETSGALLAVSQMMSKGTVQAEELRGQLGERIPGAFQIAARAMGVTTAELSEMLDQGKLLAEDFLPRFADALAREIPASADTLQASIARLGNAMTQWRQETGGALADAIVGMLNLKSASAELNRDGQITEWARKSAKAIAALIDVVRELALFVPNVIKTIGGTIAAVARDIMLAVEVAGIALTKGFGEGGRAAMRKALEERNRFIAAYNADMMARWFPKQLTERVDEFFTRLAKQQAAGARKAATVLEASLTAEQRKTLEAIKSKEERLAAEYKAHAQNLYAALTSGALSIEEYNRARKQLDAWYKAAGQRAQPMIVDRASIDAEFALLKDGLERQRRLLDQSLQDRLVSIRDYYARKTAIEQQEIDAEIARLQRLIDEQRKLQKDPRATKADRMRAKGEIAKLEADLIVLNNRRADIEQANARAAAQAERELADALAQVREELAQITGTATEADRRAAIERSFRDLRARLLAEGDTEGVSLVDRLIDVKTAQANIDAMESQWRLAVERMRIQEDSLRIQREAGLISEQEMLQRILGIHRQTAAEMQRHVELMQELAGNLGEEYANKAARIKNEYAQIAASSNEISASMREQIELFMAIIDLNNANVEARHMAGITTDMEALREREAANRRSIELLREEQSMLKAMGDTAGVLRVEAQIIRLSAQLDLVADKFRMIFEDQFAEFFDALLNHTKSFGEAWRDLWIGILREINRLIARELSQQLMKWLSGKDGDNPSLMGRGFFSWLADMFFPNTGTGFRLFASGGYVTGPGTSTSDSILARLSAGEYVLNAAAVKRVGVAFLDALNGIKAPPRMMLGRLAYASGGYVQQPVAAPAQPVRIVNVLDPRLAEDYLTSSAGERVVLNILRRNGHAVREMLR